MKAEEKQQLKAEIKQKAVNWFLHNDSTECPIEQRFVFAELVKETIIFYRMKDPALRIIERYHEKEIKLNLVSYSLWAMENLIRYKELGFETVLTPAGAEHVLNTIKAAIVNAHHHGVEWARDAHYRPIADTPAQLLDDDFCFVRLPMRFSAEPKRPSIVSIRNECGDFLPGVMERMADFDGEHSLMFEILLCFIGRAITEDTPSRQFCYWYGPGGDGKGTLLMWLIGLLEEQATTIGHDLFESRFGPGTFGHKRLVCVEEVTRGNFFTERVKELTGNEFVSVERKGQDFEQIKNRMCIIFTSNHKPSFDGTTSQRGRIRYICSKERKGGYDKPAEMLRFELQAYGAAILQAAIACYKHHDLTIPANRENELEEISSTYFADIDGLITKMFRHQEGAFIPQTLIKEILGPKRSITQFEQRVKHVLGSDEVTKVRRRMGAQGRVHGWANVGIKGDSIAGYNYQGRWIEGD